MVADRLTPQGEESLFAQMTDHLLNEQRVALGPLLDRGGEARTDLLSLQGIDHAVNFLGRQPAQAEAGEAPHAPQIGKRASEWVGAIHFDVTVGAHDEDTRLPKMADEVHEEFQRAPVGPVQVLEHEEEPTGRRRAGRGVEKAGHRLVEPPAIVLRIAGGTGRDR